jgi:PhzF family phenazine biosynthesis protein
MKLEVKFISAFTNVAFRGNPAAVIITEQWLSDELMQLIATENNLSETAFSVKQGEGRYKIRWFSPITEIDFCGHATLATAFVLFNQDEHLKELLFFAEAVGSLTVNPIDNGFIQMSFPSRKPTKIDQIPSDLIDGLSIQPQEVYRNEQAYFAIYENEEDVVAVTQDKRYLLSLAPYDVVVTAKSAEYDFISRYFWPANGGDEDPVTGSIHAGLVPYWAEKLGKTELVAFQASRRGGHLACRINANRVLVSGQAVQYLEGFIEL